MKIYTNSINCAEKLLPDDNYIWQTHRNNQDIDINGISNELFGDIDLKTSELSSNLIFKNIFIVDIASRSQYDILIEAAQKNIMIPHGTICLACCGENFHGFRGRHWDAPEGNVYLSAYFTPSAKIDNTGFAFTVLAAVSVIETLEKIPGLLGRAGIKWVNDILINDSKVSGFLTHTFSENNILTGAILGIGLNVESAPRIEPTPFVPKAACLNDFTKKRPVSRSEALMILLESLEKNYIDLIANGSQNLIGRYKEKSIIIGRKVVIYADKPNDELEEIAKGRILQIGDNLELYLDTQNEPITRGRLALI